MHAYQYAGKQTVDGRRVRDERRAGRAEHPGRPEQPAQLQDHPVLHQQRHQLPLHLCRRRPALHRRQLPVAAAPGRPARRAAHRGRPGRRQDPLRRPVERREHRLGAVAAGKTIDRILLELPRPERQGRHRVRRLDRRRRGRPVARAGRRLDPHQRRRHPPRHQRVRLVLARQQPADQRGAERLHVPHAGDRLAIEQLGVLLPAGQRREQSPDAARASRSRTSRARGWATAISSR